MYLLIHSVFNVQFVASCNIHWGQVGIEWDTPVRADASLLLSLFSPYSHWISESMPNLRNVRLESIAASGIVARQYCNNVENLAFAGVLFWRQ
jgi:hypothetical protein